MAAGKYDDIIDLPYRKSTRRPQMSHYDRAAQFSPFAALTGHNAAIRETARLTDRKIELDEDSKEHISARLQAVQDALYERPEICVTYFVRDAKKSGGAYVEAVGTVKRIDTVEQVVAMYDGTQIPIDDIFGIEGKIFDDTDFM